MRNGGRVPMKNVLEYLETTAAGLPEAAAYVDETQTVTFSLCWLRRRPSAAACIGL